MLFTTVNIILTILDSNKDANVELRITRSETNIPDINEYIPLGPISSFVASNSIKTIYMMPKLDISKDWSQAGIYNYALECEYVVYRSSMMSYSNYGSGYYPGNSNNYNEFYPQFNRPMSNSMLQSNLFSNIIDYSRINEDDEDYIRR